MTRSSQKQTFLQKHPLCCFCGGKTAAETVDHVPSRQMFALRGRPKGLEVPACRPCNQRAGTFEQIAAVMARMYPDPPVGSREAEETRKLMRKVAKASPWILEELRPSWQQQYDAGVQMGRRQAPRVLNLGGPMITRAIQLFGAKLAQGLHYNHTRTILPLTGGSLVRMYSNVDKLAGRIPNDAFAGMNEPRTLTQGRKSVADQFQYVWQAEDDGSVGYSVSTFRQSFMLVSLVVTDVALLDHELRALVISPGQWRDPEHPVFASPI